MNRKGQELIGMLPGSREEAYRNIDYFLKIAGQLAKDQPDVICCIAKTSSLELDKIAKNTEWIYKNAESMFYLIKADSKDILVIIF